MRRIGDHIGIMLAVLLLAAPAWAGPVTLLWDAAANATSTDVEQSVDIGATWTFVKNVPHVAPACAATPMTCSMDYVAPSTGLVLFRFVQVNAVGKTIRADVGPWHNEKWTLPTPARNVGAQ